MATHSSILAWKSPMDRGAWWATVHGVTKSQTRLRDSLYIFKYMKLQEANLECFYFSLIMSYYGALSNLPSLQGGKKMNRFCSPLVTLVYNSNLISAPSPPHKPSTAGWEGPPYLLLRSALGEDT